MEADMEAGMRACFDGGFDDMKADMRAGMKACFNGGFETDRTRVLMVVLMIWKLI